jgi:hypothetical protein
VADSIFKARSPRWLGLEGRHPTKWWGRPDLDVQGQKPQAPVFSAKPAFSKTRKPKETPDTGCYLTEHQKRIF